MTFLNLAQSIHIFSIPASFEQLQKGLYPLVRYFPDFLTYPYSYLSSGQLCRAFLAKYWLVCSPSEPWQHHAIMQSHGCA